MSQELLEARERARVAEEAQARTAELLGAALDTLRGVAIILGTSPEHVVDVARATMSVWAAAGRLATGAQREVL